jgi:hypothetical protein
LFQRFTDKLADALVIEKGRDPVSGDVYGHAAADDQRFGMVYLDAVPVNQRDRERSEWQAALESS